MNSAPEGARDGSEAAGTAEGETLTLTLRRRTTEAPKKAGKKKAAKKASKKKVAKKAGKKSGAKKAGAKKAGKKKVAKKAGAKKAGAKKAGKKKVAKKAGKKAGAKKAGKKKVAKKAGKKAGAKKAGAKKTGAKKVGKKTADKAGAKKAGAKKKAASKARAPKASDNVNPELDQDIIELAPVIDKTGENDDDLEMVLPPSRSDDDRDYELAGDELDDDDDGDDGDDGDDEQQAIAPKAAAKASERQDDDAQDDDDEGDADDDHDADDDDEGVGANDHDYEHDDDDTGPASRTAIAVEDESDRNVPEDPREILRELQMAARSGEAFPEDVAPLVEALEKRVTPSLLPELFGVLEDEDPHGIYWHIFYLLESFDEAYLEALADALPSLAERAPRWAETALIRIINSRGEPDDCTEGLIDALKRRAGRTSECAIELLQGVAEEGSLVREQEAAVAEIIEALGGDAGKLNPPTPVLEEEEAD